MPTAKRTTDNIHGLFGLTGKVAVVTGATRGLGRAIALGLSGAGAHVVVSSRKQDECTRTAHEIQDATGIKALGLACHVGQWDDVHAFADDVVSHFGGVDILVNNAGINPMCMPLETVDRNLWRKVFEINVEGPLRVAQTMAPVMRARGGGSIINIASMAAHMGTAELGAYSASKAALLNMSWTMSEEWAPWGVRVNVISPGPFLTTLSSAAVRADPEFRERTTALTTMKRIGDPSEIVGPVLYLASEASSYVTGDELSVSGGIRR
jgi:NAD(P)-dependent dehydrogenase (short-subunit alcohol dehydrogenase family)